MTTTPTPWNSLTQTNTTDGAQTAMGFSQNSPSIAALSDGGYLIVWQDLSFSTTQIRGQRYDVLGHKVGGELDLDHRVEDASEPTVVQLADGSIATGFEFVDGNDPRVIVHRYSINLKSFVTDQIGLGVGPDIAAFKDGGYVVTSRFHNGNTNSVQANIVSATGVVGPDIVIGTANQVSAAARVATLTDGTFVVVNQVNNLNSTDTDIIFNHYARNGANLGGAFVVGAANVPTPEANPDVAALKGGGFVVAWEDGAGDQNGFGIRATIYNSQGTVVRGDFLVDTTQVGNQDSASVTALADGGFIVNWDDREAGGAIRAQRFDAVGDAIGTEFSLGAPPGDPAAGVTLEDGRVAFAISRFAANDFDILTHIFDPRTSPIVGTNGPDKLTARLDGGTVKGVKGDDVLYGFGGKDHLAGGKGSDKLKGGGGADVLAGGKGADKLYAGHDDARDTFVFGKGDSGTGDGKFDKIFGFDRQNGHEKLHDVVDLSDLHVKLKDVDLSFDKHSVTLLVDTHGGAKPDMVIEIMHIHDLNPGDLLL